MFGSKKRIVRFATAAAAGAALFTIAAPAQAYDGGYCNGLFGSANVADVDTLAVDAGAVDFGDHSHNFGRPWGTAVVCWSTDGRVAIQGRVFADTLNNQITATAKITFGQSTTSYGVVGSHAASALVSRVSGFGTFNAIRIRLIESGHSGLGPYSKERLDAMILRGD